MKKISFLAATAVLAVGATTFALRGQAESADAPKIGASVAAFTLPDATSGKTATTDWKGAKASVVLFIATRCPVSNAYNERMSKLAATYGAKGVKFYGVNSNKQEDAAEIAEHAKDHNLGFPVLKDAGHVVADRFDAQVTPEAYVIDSKGVLVYHGQFDNDKNEARANTPSLQNALDEVLAEKAVQTPEARAFGCSIKR